MILYCQYKITAIAMETAETPNAIAMETAPQTRAAIAKTTIRAAMAKETAETATAIAMAVGVRLCTGLCCAMFVRRTGY